MKKLIDEWVTDKDANTENQIKAVGITNKKDIGHAMNNIKILLVDFTPEEK